MTLLMERVAAMGRSGNKVALVGVSVPADVVDETSRDCAAALRQATRFVLTDDMVSLALDLAEGPPGPLAAAMDMIRPPATSWWLEWDEHHRQREVSRRHGPFTPQISEEVAQRVGLLLTPSIVGDGSQTATAFTLHGKVVCLSPAGWTVGFGNADFCLDMATRPNDAGGMTLRVGDGDVATAMFGAADALLGRGYMFRQLPVETPQPETISPDALARGNDFLRLAGYGATALSPLGGRWVSLIRRASGGGLPDHAKALLNDCFMEQAGEYRFVMAVLATMQAAGDAVAATTTTSAPAGAGRAAGRSLRSAPISHKVVSLRIHPDEVRRRLAQRERAARATPRWHTFTATRCYSRKRGNPACEHEWFRPDPERDFHRCAKCDMRSWPRQGGEKGDPSKGRIEKTYIVSAS